jgi:class 3 adenylate cyclase
MPSTEQRTVLFADLRGSTGLYESLGNNHATRLVTDSIGSLSQVIQARLGRVIKTLGDGLMATFDDAFGAVQAASDMQALLQAASVTADTGAAGAKELVLKLQVALARGEVVTIDGDCFGDAVNVSARLLDHAGDNEVLATAEVLAGLPDDGRLRFRSLDRIQLRGRGEAVHVYLLNPLRGQDFAATTCERTDGAPHPEGLRISWQGSHRVYSPQHLPVILGRSPDAHHIIDDARVSRMHARIDWHGGTFQLSDLSYNGSFVRFDNDAAVVSLRRGRCTLHGRGLIGLGAPPVGSYAPCLRFEVLRFGDTEINHFIDLPPPSLAG